MVRLREEISASGYQAKLDEKTATARGLDHQRDRLNDELTSSTQLMQSRANLSMRQEEAQKLDAEIQSMSVHPLDMVTSYGFTESMG
jgi:hypothetical protein